MSYPSFKEVRHNEKLTGSEAARLLPSGEAAD